MDLELMQGPLGTGSAWENATLFDFNGELLPGADFFDYDYDHVR